MKKIICGIALVALAAGCGKKDEKKGEAGKPADTAGGAAAGGEAGGAAKPAEAGGKEIPNISGLVADVPANAVPNGMGGAAGFHSEDGTFQFTIMETSAEEAAKDIETMKKDEEEFAKKWVKAEPTADGWVLEWETPKLDLSSGEPKEVGTEVAYQVRRKIADKTYTCYGQLPTAEQVDAAVKVCAGVKAK